MAEEENLMAIQDSSGYEDYSEEKDKDRPQTKEEYIVALNEYK